MSERESTLLEDVRKGANSCMTWGSFNESGDLVVRSSDVGPAVESWIGAYEYEYSFTIGAEDKNKMLLELLKDRFQERDFSFQAWLKQHAIKYGFWDWWTYK